MGWLLAFMFFPTILAAQAVMLDAKPLEVGYSISVDSLKNRKRGLLETVKQGKKRLQQLDDSLKGLRADSLSLCVDLQEVHHHPTVQAEEWERQMQALTTSNHLLEAHRDSLQRVLAALKDRQIQLANRRAQLDSVKAAVAVGFVQIGMETLEKPFSKLKWHELMNLKKQSQEFEGCTGVPQLLACIDAKTREKTQCDEAEQVVNRRFHADSVSLCIRGLEVLRDLSEPQQAEVQSLLESLRLFDRGRTVLREFVEGFARERDRGIEGPSDCKEVIALVLEKNDLAKRIEEQVMPVPYLKRCYEELRQAVMRDFKRPTKIEENLLVE